MLTAVEPSADLLGAALMDALRAGGENIVFCGCGGPAMAARGLHSRFPIDAFSVIGPIDAVKALPAARRAARELGGRAARQICRAAGLGVAARAGPKARCAV